LALQGNQISIIENLANCKELLFLDLSKNIIEILPTINKLKKALPFESLGILNLIGNKITNNKNYKNVIINSLPLIEELDKKELKVYDKLIYLNQIETDT